MIVIDLLYFFRKEPIIIKNCFNFSLKTIGKNMYKHCMIKSTWSDTDNGLDAMIKFKEVCLSKEKSIRNLVIDEATFENNCSFPECANLEKYLI